MNERIAESEGFVYVGPVVSSWPSGREKSDWESDLQRAKNIRKTYNGADYRIVTGTARSWLGTGSRAIYGNEVFNKIWQLTRYETFSFENRAARLEATRTAMLERHRQELDQLRAEFEKLNEDKKFLEDLRKSK